MLHLDLTSINDKSSTSKWRQFDSWKDSKDLDFGWGLIESNGGGGGGINPTIPNMPQAFRFRLVKFGTVAFLKYRIGVIQGNTKGSITSNILSNELTRDTTRLAFFSDQITHFENPNPWWLA